MGRIGNQRGPWQSVGCGIPPTLHNIYYHGFICDLHAGSLFHVGSLRLSTTFCFYASGHVRTRARGTRMRVVRSLTRLTTDAPQKAPGVVPSTDDARRYQPQRHSAYPTSAAAQNQPSTGWPRYAATLVAAMAPSEAAVTICRRLFCRTSPAAKSPGVEVSMRSLVTT